MPAQRALIFDIDGTLVAAGGRPTPATVSAITQCRDLGHACFVATARRPASARSVLGELAWLVDSGAFHAGALGQCRVSAWQDATTLPGPLVDAVISLAERLVPHATISIHSAAGHAAFGPVVPSEAVLRGWSVHSDELTPFAQARYASACKLAVITRTGTLHALVDELGRRWPQELSALLVDGGSFVNITHGGTSKAAMMGRLLQQRGRSWAQAIACGDDLSDAQLLGAAGYAVAIAGGHPATLAVADAVVAGPADSGVAHFLAREIPGVRL